MIWNRQIRDLTNIEAILTTNTNWECCFVKTIAMTSWTWQLIHITSHDIASEITIGLVIATIDISHNPFKRNVNITHPTKIINIMEVEFAVPRSIEDQILFFFFQIFKWCIHIHTELLHGLLKHSWIIVGWYRIPRRQSTFTQGFTSIRDNQIHINFQFITQTITGRTRAKRCIEWKETRLQLWHCEATNWTRIMLWVKQLIIIHSIHNQVAIC